MRAEGFQWLLIYLASLWAGDAGRPDGLKTDKIPILDRIEWAVANEGTLLSYATSPTENQGWMNADAPWQFLAGCMELRNLREWQIAQGDLNNFDYLTGYEAYLDGYTAVLKLCELGGRLEQVIPTQVKSGLTTILKRSTAKRLEAHNT
jgi:DNA-directed RNA polymerase